MSATHPSDPTPARGRFLGAGLAATALGAAAGAAPTLAGGLAGRPQPRPLAAAIAKSGSDSAVLPPFAVRVLHKMGFGPARRDRVAGASLPAGGIFRAGFEAPPATAGLDDVAHFMNLGADDDSRLAAYVEEQLNPNLPDPDLQTRMAEFPTAFATLSEPLASTWSARECRDFSDYARPQREVERAALTRAVFSRRQLFELMADFWHNHFNIFSQLSEDTYVSWASWDRDVVRANTFGNFYNMVWASARHPAMLRYLDNYRNSEGGFNENYARELLELHTLGAENYRGLAGQLSIEALAENPYTAINDAELNDPSLSGGLAIADPTRQIARYYVDDDVYAAAQALSGWRYEDANVGGSCGTGGFFVSESDHYITTKAILSRGLVAIGADQGGEVDGRLAIKLAVYHPGTAIYVARKLCRRFISDDPPEGLVQRVADAFFLYRTFPDQIARTLRVLLNSDEFKDPANWGSKIKRPFEYVASALRAAACRHTFREGDSTSGEFFGVFNATGQRLFSWRTPDGFPDRREHWEGSSSLIHCWRSIDWLTDRNASDVANRVLPIIDLTLHFLPGDPTPRQIVVFWCDWLMGFTPAGGWVGPIDSSPASAPTSLGRAALQFFTQLGFSGANDRTPWSADEPIARAELSENRGGFDWNLRLRGLVALILWSPNFMQR